MLFLLGPDEETDLSPSQMVSNERRIADDCARSDSSRAQLGAGAAQSLGWALLYRRHGGPLAGGARPCFGEGTAARGEARLRLRLPRPVARRPGVPKIS